MVGTAVQHVFKGSKTFEVHTTSRKKSKDPTQHSYDATQNDISDILKTSSFDFIVNCMGHTNKVIDDSDPTSIVDAIRVNAELPHAIAKALEGSSTKCIHLSTDCVFDGRQGNYHESATPTPTDIYSQTKLLGEVYYSPQLLNIRTSIIGHKDTKDDNLLDWFLAHKDNETCDGYVNHLWNGTSNLTFATLIEAIIKEEAFDKLREANHTHHYAGTDTLSKYELLKKVNKIYNRDIKIKKVTHGRGTNRSLASDYSLLEELVPNKDIGILLKELKESYARD